MNYMLRCNKKRYTNGQLESMEWASNHDLDISKYDYPDKYNGEQMRQLYEANLLGLDLSSMSHYDWRLLSEIKLAMSQDITFDIPESTDNAHIQMVVSRETIINELKENAKIVTIDIASNGDIDFLLLGSITIYKLKDNTYRFDTNKYKFITKGILLHLLINENGGFKAHPARKELLDMNFSKLFKEEL